MKRQKLPFRPYARLLTMLGDQLIKNERTALVELIKNSYDADADWVKVRFEGFDPDMSPIDTSMIVVEDNGCGMKPTDIRSAWMNPATPQKYLRKKEGREKTPNKGRIIQGEKGIGRFAILKLGKEITITTRTSGSSFDSVLTLNFSQFDEDFTTNNGESKEIFLDQIGASYTEVPASGSISAHGTIIEIRNLKGSWNGRMVERLCQDVASLTDPVSKIVKDVSSPDDFRISIIKNEDNIPVEHESVDELRGLIEDKSVLQVQGEFKTESNAYLFKTTEHGPREIVKLDDPKIKGLWIWRKRHDGGQDLFEPSQCYACGSFKFRFYIFSFGGSISGKYELTPDDKKLLKNHRIYLYRDGVRVYPYGDPDDDWLGIDIARGTGRAGDFFSNDQIIGWIDITQKENKDLADKTSREGLIEKGNALEDFLFIIKTFLSYIRQNPYLRFQQQQKERKKIISLHDSVITERLGEIKSRLEKKGAKVEARAIEKLGKEYHKEKLYLVQRFKTAEDLAGVGLSVEMTSHDIMLLINRAASIGKETAKLANRHSDNEIQVRADMLVGVLSQIVDGMRDIQSLFKSSKRRKKHLKIEPILDKIHSLYEGLLKKRGIKYTKNVLPGSPLVANIVDGVVMQVIINLFDNAAYWLDTVDNEDRQICVTLDGSEEEIIFSDNGPGIDKEDEPYIFEAFYSGKGQQGRGLGLYIARQLLDRYGYSIEIMKGQETDRSGVSFRVSFIEEDA